MPLDFVLKANPITDANNNLNGVIFKLTNKSNFKILISKFTFGTSNATKQLSFYSTDSDVKIDLKKIYPSIKKNPAWIPHRVSVAMSASPRYESLIATMSIHSTCVIEPKSARTVCIWTDKSVQYMNYHYCLPADDVLAMDVVSSFFMANAKSSAYDDGDHQFNSEHRYFCGDVHYTIMGSCFVKKQKQFATDVTIETTE